MKKRTRNILIGSGVVATCATLVSQITTKYLVKLAMDRETPKSMNKGRERLRGRKEIVDFYQKMMDDSIELESKECEEVEITSYDGLRLIGHWYPCENAKRIIIAMHGWRSSWSRDFGMISEFWHDNGCSVLFAEQRGQNNSGGDYMGFGLLERYDCLEWIHWVNKYTGGGLPIYLGGASMGAATVLMTAGLELPSNVKGIIADCGFTSPYAIWKHVVQNNLHLPYGLYRAAANDLCKKRIKMDTKAYSTVDAMKKCKVPVLFIHGTDDHFVPVEMTYENYKACRAPKRLFVVPGAEHGMSYYVDKNGYEKNLIEFWSAYD